MTNIVSLFSARLTFTVDQLSARLEAEAAQKGGPRVLIVPGLPGSELGHRGTPDGAPNDVIWFDPGSVRAGRLLDLAYGRPIDPLGLLSLVYLQMILRLQLAGFDVGLHPYDWRRPLPDLGAELSARIAAEEREVHVVAHSFGCLVARAAAVVGTPGMGKVIMLGPPNHGSFAPLQGIRGDHWSLHVLSAMDGRHTPIELAEGAFRTWPSIYQTLPPRAASDGFDLYDPALWPAGGPQPDRDLLLGAPAVQAWMGPSTGRFHIVAGYGFPTVQRVEVHDGLFVYHEDDDGDGFVSTGSARLDGYPCHYVRSSHASMPNHDAVIRAVADLLTSDTTDQLSTAAPAPSPCLARTEGEIVEPPFGGRRGDEINIDDVRAVLEELAGFVG